MSLGNQVEQAIRRTESEGHQLRVYECVNCGRAFAREKPACPACGGVLESVLLS